MAVITKQSLQYQYSWTAIPPDDARSTGMPDSVLLNRQEGYEMLHFLNRISQSPETALKAERMIKTSLPGTVRSREHVLKWLQDNWAAA